MEKETTLVRNQHKNNVFIHNLPDLQWLQRTIVGKSYPRHINQHLISLAGDLSHK